MLSIIMFKYGVVTGGRDYLGQVLDVLEQNPFQALQAMKLDIGEEWRPYDSAEAHTRLVHDEAISLWLRGRTEEDLWCVISCQQVAVHTISRLWVANDLMRAISSEQCAAYIQSLVRLIPAFEAAIAGAEEHLDALYDQEQVPRFTFSQVPYPRWLTFWGRKEYTPYFQRETLLQAPVYRATEDEQGTICLQVYEDHTASELPANQQKLVELARYLLQHQKLQPTPTASPPQAPAPHPFADLLISKADADRLGKEIAQTPGWSYFGLMAEEVERQGMFVERWMVMATYLPLQKPIDITSVAHWNEVREQYH